MNATLAPEAGGTVRTVIHWRPAPHIVALAGIIALAAVVRLAGLGAVPAPLSHDEVVKGYDAWSILHTGRDQYGERFPLVFRALGDYREAAMPYAIALSESVFGPTDFAVRLPAALAGVALVGVTYLLGAELFGRMGGLMVAAFLSISPWHVQISRLGFRAGLTPLCIVAGLWLLLRALRERRSLVPAGVVLGLSLHTYLGARAFLPLLVIGLAIIYRRELRCRPRAVIAGGSALLVVAAPLALWGLTHRAEFLGHAGKSSGWHEAPSAPAFAAQVARKYAAYLDHGNLVLHGDPYPVPSTGRFGVLYWPELPLFAAGLVVLARRRERSDLLVLWWLLAFPLAPALADGRPPDWLRSTTGLPVFELVGAAGASAFWPLVARRRAPPILRLALSLGFAAAILLNATWFGYDYTMRFPERAALAFHAGIREAVLNVAQDQERFAYVVLPRSVPGVHDYYLFYTRYDPRRLHSERLEDVAAPGEWADVRGFGTVTVCEPHACCGRGALCIVEGSEPALPPPRFVARDGTGAVRFSVVEGMDPSLSVR